MRWPLVSRRSYDDLNARYQQALDATAKAREERNAFRTAAQTSARQFVEADATNKRLDGRVKELTHRLEKAVDGGDASYVAQLERRLERLARAVLALRTRASSDTRQIDQAKRLHDELRERARKAEALLETHALVHGERPIEGGPGRPQPSAELRQARDHARALDERLAEVTAANQRCTCGGAA
ncbi:hypothetical protein [Streptomyces purpurascens]|uniref:hypothetical protein n=1 Tax=Streptomyces purpurascens TaxID=1924 RepID=UPI001674B8A2|nr:hypothetical protein [Streptomyces purpurascens]MCE7049513.1 gp58-like family protein [Streptomyces purpurascens]GHA22229.1 hypothetical protein GCM10010303_35920 [Streptomyces purpurascens]